MTQDQPDKSASSKTKSAVEKPSSSPPAEKKDSKRPDPTRYQDWEKGGRCIDF
jgi:hypothetical protein